MESSSQRHELIRREPIFHHPELIWDAGSFDDVVQVLYTLRTPSRVTRRSTLYRRRDSIWQAVFHQGTVIEGATALSPDD